jgi:hypothetical protein
MMARKTKAHVFDFSQEQWRAIMAAVNDGCVQPAFFNRAMLANCINWYLEDLPSYQRPSDRAAEWRRIAKALGKVRSAIIKANPSAVIDMPVGATQPKVLAVEALLTECQKFAAESATFRGRPHPSTQLYDFILDVWFDAGGRLSKSRENPLSPKAGAVGGPTVRYLQAVLTPVMRDKVPSPEGLRRIIDRIAAEWESSLPLNEPQVVKIEAVQRGDDPVLARKRFLTEHGRRFAAELMQYTSGGEPVECISPAQARALVRGKRGSVASGNCTFRPKFR